MSTTVDATLSVMALNHLVSRTADADTGNKTSETTLMKVVNDIFRGTVIFGNDFGQVI